jgi:two-component system, NarL family, sensor histidine kinase DesK
MAFDLAEDGRRSPVGPIRAAERADARSQPKFGDGEDIPAPKLARRILFVVVCSYVFTGVLDIQADNPGTASHIGSYICMGLVFSLQIAHMSRAAPRWPVWLKATTLTTQTVLTYLPFIAFHQLWGGMAGLLAGSFLLLLRRPLAWVFFWIVSLSMAIIAINIHEPLAWIAYFVVSTYLLGLIIYGLSRLTQLVGELHAARSDLARMAVARERLRFARDLHDLLGYSLSSITLKSELTYRLVHIQPDRARRELASILEVARQALADVRVVASSYRDLRLAEEVESVQSVLRAAGVEVRVRMTCEELSPALDTVLATTLREGATNMLRHSKVQRCSITCVAERPAGGAPGGTVRLELANDGVSEDKPLDQDVGEHAGSGLDNLAQRLQTVGGTLTAGVGEDERFHLVAQAPLVYQRVQPAADVWEDGLEEPNAA